MIKNRMKVILAERGVKQTELAEATGDHYTTIQRFCTQRRTLNLDVADRVCKALKINTCDILRYTPDEDIHR